MKSILSSLKGKKVKVLLSPGELEVEVVDVSSNVSVLKLGDGRQITLATDNVIVVGPPFV